MSSLPANIKRIGSKATEERWRHRFPHYKSIRAFCCHGHQSFDPICPKTLCSLSPTPVMLHIEFDQDWPTGFSDIQVRKCGLWTIGSLRLRWAKNLDVRLQHLQTLKACLHYQSHFDQSLTKSLWWTWSKFDQIEIIPISSQSLKDFDGNQPIRSH